MDRDIYQAPESDLVAERNAGQPFYVVARGKFLWLYLSTLGIYGVYWFYRHWECYRRHSGQSLWPVPRAIFSIFFAHSLFARFNQAAVAVNPDLHWGHRTYATLYVVFVLISSLSDRLTLLGLGLVSASLIGLAAFFVVAWVKYHAQGVANMACGDPRGDGNRRITIANIAWILLGFLMWLLTIAGILLSLGVPGLEQG